MCYEYERLGQRKPRVKGVGLAKPGGGKLHYSAVTRQDVTALLEERFPPTLALEWDHSGLQAGTLARPCRRAMVALDFDLSILPRLQGVDLLVTHHPLLFRPVHTIRPETPLGQKLRTLLTEDVACYAVHTPYDIAHGGLGEVLAAFLDLRGVRPLAPQGRLLKLVMFVPQGHVEAVADAVFSAGAGKIGRYGRCSFRAQGTGTFLPEVGARPYLGEVGKEERVAEVRLETVVPAERLPQVLRAMFSAHPYEEVAYDVYPLEGPPGLHGLGRVGELSGEAAGEDLAQKMATALGASQVQTYGDLTRPVGRVALCGGSGGTLWPDALAVGAELYITGEIDYHDGIAAAESGLAVVALGHRESERPFVGHVANILRQGFPGLEVMEG